MSPQLPLDWNALTEGHTAAVQQFLAAARQFPLESWTAPLAPGKWTPAEVTSHLTQSYGVLRRELAGGTGMTVRVTPWQRWMLSRTVFPGILAGKPFPAKARAPVETRPRDVIGDPAVALRSFTHEAESFVQDLTSRAARERVQLTHAYFGQMSARQSLQLATVHTRHHARQLAERHP